MRRLFVIMAMSMFLILGAGQVFADNEVTFQWAANSETDLAGYRLHQGATAGGPYDEVAPVDVPLAALTDVDNPEFTITSVADGQHFWVLTAYDDATPTANESGYSNEVSALLDSAPPADPTILEIIGVVRAP